MLRNEQLGTIVPTRLPAIVPVPPTAKFRVSHRFGLCSRYLNCVMPNLVALMMLCLFDVVGPAARWFVVSTGIAVFRTWVMTMTTSPRLAQWVEHQTVTLAVAGSTPVPTPTRKSWHTAHENADHEAGGRRAFVRSAFGRFALHAGLNGSQDFRTERCGTQLQFAGGSMKEHFAVRGFRGEGWRQEAGEKQN